MQPSEPRPEETSLELTFPERDANTEATGTDLTLPPSDLPPLPPVPAPDDQTRSPGPLGDLVAAHFRRVQNAMLGRVLITTLGGALPASMVEVEHRRSWGKRRGEPIGISVTSGERRLVFRCPDVGVADASISHVVGGIVLSTTKVPVARWLDELGTVLDDLTGDDEATRVALEQALLH